METVSRSGEPCWVDLSTTDVGAAGRFYRELLGWSITARRTSMGEYHVATVGDREVAGMMAQAPELAGMPSAWTVFVYVEDLDVTLRRLRDAGGAVLQEPFEIPGGARVAVGADAGGAMFALISEVVQPGPYFSTDAGAVGWIELMTRAPDAAERFYGHVFGWTATTDDVDGVPYTTFRLDGAEIAGMLRTPADLPADVADVWSVYFAVGDCDAAVERAAHLGGEILHPPTPTPMGPFAVVADPQGAVFELIEPTTIPADA